MFYTPVDYFSVLLAALAGMVVGFVWYSPLLFAKPWMRYAKIDAKKLKESQKKMGKTYVMSFITTVVTAFILALLLNASLVITMTEGLMLGGVVWLGFVATTMFTGVLFSEMPMGLFLINSGYQLASILVMSAILTAMM
ncbi:DUF1761 domain-containing protein [Candidatus Gottesmanbacteria bacterium]|nr:DUF1761 domain-containing protein [Candidatus Gottesmanbacteria bacterium]